jgi:predicted nucleic acid-binding protein
MIVDSDVLIDASRGDPEIVNFLIQSGNDETLYVSVISYLELQAGARDKIELRRIEKFLSRFVLLTIDDPISQRAMSLMREYRLSHGLALPDALIAATAIESGETLATRNAKHFAQIAALRTIPP